MRTLIEALAALKRAMFLGARPEAAFGAYLALTVGAVGFIISWALVAAYVRDFRFVLSAEKSPRRRVPPRFGPLHMSLGAFLASPIGRSVLSPDAAAEFVGERLDAQQEFLQSVVRFFSYTPLLCGLMGTILALRGLLVDSGRTLQEIQPDLAGVFGGTLAGIVGSLLAAVGSVVLDAVVRRVNIRAQDLINLRVLPEIPDRRISIQIEEAILERIGAKAEGVAAALKDALQPLATTLTSTAETATKAAASASDAFTTAARAVREAGDLEKVTRSFKSTAHMLDSSAASLSDATRQTAETLLRFGDIQSSASATATGLVQSSVALAAATREIGGALESRTQTLAAQSAAIDTSIRTIAALLDGLLGRLSVQAERDSANSFAIRAQSEQAEKTLETVSAMATEVSSRLTALAEGFLGMHKQVVDELRQSTLSTSTAADPRLAEGLAAVVPALKRCADELSAAVEEMRARRETRGGPPGESSAQIHSSSQQRKDLVQAVMRPAENVVGEQAEKHEPHRYKADGPPSVVNGPPSVVTPGFFARLFRRKVG